MRKPNVLVLIFGLLLFLVLGSILAVKAVDNRVAGTVGRVATRYEDSAGKPYWKLTPGPANAYLIPLDEGYLMIDTGYPEDLQPVLKALDSEGIAIEDIRYLFITHAHDDHAGFAAEIRRRSGCRLIVSQSSLSALHQGRFEWHGKSVNLPVDVASKLYTIIKQRDFSFEPVIVQPGDSILTGTEVPLPETWGLKGHFLHTPGHSADSWSLMLDDGRAFVGDAAMNMLSVLGAGNLPIFMEDRAEVYRSLERIKAKHPAIVLTGHGEPLSIHDFPSYRQEASKGPGIKMLMPYAARLAVGLLLIAALLLTAGRNIQLLRIFCYIFAFIFMRDLMTPFGFWTIASEPVFHLRFATDTLLLGSLALGSLLLSFGIHLLESRAGCNIQWVVGSRGKSLVFGVLGALLVVGPVLFLYRGILPAERAGEVPSSAIGMIVLFALCGNLLEELLFRGYVLQYVRSKGLTPTNAVLASSLLFTLCHLFLAYIVTNAGMPLLVFVLWEGLVCGFLSTRYGLLSAILTHGFAIGILAVI